MRWRCLLVVAGVAAMVGAANNASAISHNFVDIDEIGAYLSDGANQTVFGILDIVTGEGDTVSDPIYDLDASDADGFMPSSDWVTDATVKLFIRDDSYDVEQTSTVVGSFWAPFEIAVAIVEGGGFGSTGFGTISTKIFEFGSVTLRAAVQDDGQVQYSVSAGLGDFVLDYAMLEVTAERKAGGASVPDGGLTLSLLGVAMIFVERFRRHMS